MRDLVARLRATPPVTIDAPLAVTFVTDAAPAAPWDRRAIAERLGVALPADVAAFWDEAAEAAIHRDATFGQWGLVALSPERAVARTLELRRLRAEHVERGDLVVGEFLGDSDLAIVRADPADAELGSVVIALPIDARPEWPTVARSWGEFLARFLTEGRERKYWESR